MKPHPHTSVRGRAIYKTFEAARKKLERAGMINKYIYYFTWPNIIIVVISIDNNYYNISHAVLSSYIIIIIDD